MRPSTLLLLNNHRMMDISDLKLDFSIEDGSDPALWGEESSFSFSSFSSFWNEKKITMEMNTQKTFIGSIS